MTSDSSTANPTSFAFAKGHGTENDFIIIEDVHDEHDLSPAQVAAICDRRAGIGADGLLRVVRKDDMWFMDYRNADGSIAEMCGNGVRVFAHYVRSRGLSTTDNFPVLTRAGVREVSIHSADEFNAEVTVDMGPATVTGLSTVSMGNQRFAGLGVDMGNPHLAAVIPGLDASKLAELELSTPEFDLEFFPAGVNVEILTPLEEGAVHMRVYERGVGETRSCGTGTVAAARVALADQGKEDGEVDVHVPGGTVRVRIEGDSSTLTGPSKIIAVGTLSL